MPQLARLILETGDVDPHKVLFAMQATAQEQQSGGAAQPAAAVVAEQKDLRKRVLRARFLWRRGRRIARAIDDGRKEASAVRAKVAVADQTCFHYAERATQEVRYKKAIDFLQTYEEIPDEDL